MLDVEDAKTFWTKSPDAICTALACTRGGLSSQEAATRLVHDGPNSDTTPRRVSVVRSIGRRLIEPLSLILIVAGAVSAGTGDTIGGSIIVVILGLSIGLDTLQERQAAKTAEALRNTVALKAEVKRDGVFKQIYVEQVVAGDVLRVRGGDIIPADALVIESTAFTAGEAALTGEPYPVEKRAGTVAALNAAQASNALFRGSVCQTGEATVVVVRTGKSTLFGAVASILAEDDAQSPFQRDLHNFGMLTARMTIALVLVVLTAHIFRTATPPIIAVLRSARCWTDP